MMPRVSMKYLEAEILNEHIVPLEKVNNCIELAASLLSPLTIIVNLSDREQEELMG